MKSQEIPVWRLGALALAALLALPPVATAQSARERYGALQARQDAVMTAIASTPADTPATARDKTIRDAHNVIAGYDALVRRFHGSGYADNALWNAATIADALFKQFSQPADAAAARRYTERLIAEYPSSSLIKQLAVTPGAPTAPAAPIARVAPVAPGPGAILTAIDRSVMPEGVRVTLSLSREVSYREEKLDGPSRVFFDLKNVQTLPELRDVVLRYGEDAVRQIRVGRHPDKTVRVVLDLEGVKKYSVFTMYNPFRLVVDCEPVVLTAAEGGAKAPARQLPLPAASTASFRSGGAFAPPVRADAPTEPAPAPVQTGEPRTEPVAPIAPSTPVPLEAPATNAAGGFSLSRQLGLSVMRVVIDPGHGGHDPGAQSKGLNESDLTLDIALRVEKLLKDEGLDVVLTRRSDVYVPLEERTAIANRENADLFLSIHANASRNEAARGVETYFLSFASTADAEAVAARENSASAGGMHNLPDIIKAIALNNKLDESRDLAGMVQEALVSRLRRSNKNVRNLGVKKAPFVVLIGAAMPSVLAEISFITNKQELQLLKSAAYKQRVAEALHASVMRYRRSLKGQVQIAAQ